MFATLSDRLTSTFKNLRGKGKLSDADVDATIREIRRALLDADVALPVVREFTGAVRERALGAEVSEALNPGQQVVKIVNEELIEILGGQTRELALAKNPPTVIMLAGLQGAGKTTFAGKLAHYLKGKGHAPVLVACDLQRPNAVTQLQVVGERANVPVFAPHPGAQGTEDLDRPAGDPITVAAEAIEFANQKQHDIVIVDTAGRLGVDQQMMTQAFDIRVATGAHEVLFVVDSMIGQDAVTTAESFASGVGITGVVLTKLDSDARGGAALSVAKTTGVPVMYASTGEKLDEFELFHPDRMASRILDMGDVLTLIEQAEKAFDANQAEEMAGKFIEGKDFNLEDFLVQMQSMRKMGSMKKMLTMLPGMGEMRDVVEQFDEREIDRVEAIVHSMTPLERKNPKIINGSRRARIAKGCGRTVTDVNQLLDRFAEAQKMMRAMRNGGGIPGMPGMGGGMPGMAGIPGMGGMPGGAPGKGKGKARKAKKGKKNAKGRSGNPAKRAQQESEQPSSATGSAFGIGNDSSAGINPDDLPPGFEKLLGK